MAHYSREIDQEDRSKLQQHSKLSTISVYKIKNPTNYHAIEVSQGLKRRSSSVGGGIEPLMKLTWFFAVSTIHITQLLVLKLGPVSR